MRTVNVFALNCQRAAHKLIEEVKCHILYLLMKYLTILSAAQALQRLMLGLLVNTELYRR